MAEGSALCLSDLEKAYDRVHREELWECLRLAETSEGYIRVIKDMYDGAAKL